MVRRLRADFKPPTKAACWRLTFRGAPIVGGVSFVLGFFWAHDFAPRAN
jgi:hypothetical protein